MISTPHLDVTIGETDREGLICLRLRTGETFALTPPLFEIEAASVRASLDRSSLTAEPRRKLPGGAREHAFRGALVDDPDLSVRVVVRVHDESPLLRFRYELFSRVPRRLTRTTGADRLEYLSVGLPVDACLTEVGLSEFDELAHSFRLNERSVSAGALANGLTAMGPLLTIESAGRTAVLAYEHGSQVPDAFIRFSLSPETVTMEAVKGNYWAGRELGPDHPYRTVWLQAGLIAGDLAAMRRAYRDFALRVMSPNRESRRPYLFYNTWNYQERNKWWNGQPYLESMNEQRMLDEIDVAHRLGIEVFVIDTGWYEKTGDWAVDRRRFPDGLKRIRKRLEEYGMKLGLWFNPTVAAVTSRLADRYASCRVTRSGELPAPREIWETEESYAMCLVSDYAEAFAEKLIELVGELGVTYFKWDAIGQYGCDDPGHHHGTASNDASERADCYAFEIGRAMNRIVDRLCEACPEAIVDFDITEGGRYVGLGFLASGKYFLINNGPYSWSLDMPQTADGNPNLFFYPGQARHTLCRMPLDYDSWIPSVLFLTHYLPDDPAESRLGAAASLVLGQNGIWGDLLSLSEEGIGAIGAIAGLYRHVRDDVTASYPVVSGRVGGSPEVHEKINDRNGRGLVAIFAAAAGTYTYVTQHSTAAGFHAGEGVTVQRDGNGLAVIEVTFTAAGGRLVFFGVPASRPTVRPHSDSSRR